MLLREFASMAVGNLWRMKLRTLLTAGGVVVGIGALVSMLSFAFGVQKNVAGEFEKIGLFRTLQVLPPEEGTGDSAAARVLDSAALEAIESLPGVKLVYPQQSFDAKVTGDSLDARAVVQVLPATSSTQRNLGTIRSGRFFASDSAREAVVSAQWLKEVGIPPDSVLGDTLRFEAASVPDLALGLAGRVLERVGVPSDLARVAGEFARRLLDLLEPSRFDLEVVGVAEINTGFGFRMGDVLIPPDVVEGMDLLSFDDPLELMALLSSSSSEGWPMFVVTLEHERDHDRVRQGIIAMGLRVVSFLDRFAEMKRGFLFFDAIVAILGFIALFVASLGIVNTMVMSIIERTREIGILKSLGAEDRDIRLLFLVESASIGLIGSLGGVLLGWIVSRVASLAAQEWMVRQGAPKLDMFHLPVWVALGAIAFGILVSMLAGLYPANRASRVDPVEALRHD